MMLMIMMIRTIIQIMMVKKRKFLEYFFEVSNSNELDFNKLKNDYQFFLNEMVNIKQK